uniref:Uncharacterized protein n=1 Tax=Glycine max TaxID=3847 RepID=A0A0R0GH15_SOYBN
MVHGILQFTPSIAFRYVSSMQSRDIRCRESYGHAPPPIESRKSSQSVNPYYVWTWCQRSPKSTSADPWSASFMVETRTLGQERIAGRRDEPTGAHRSGPIDPTKVQLRAFNCNNLIYAMELELPRLLAPDLPSMSPTHEPGIVIVTTSPCQDWVFARCCFLDVVAVLRLPLRNRTLISVTRHTMVGHYPTIES